MKMKYFIDDSNNYIGGSDNKSLSNNEVPFAPDDARQKWNGTNYDSISSNDLDAEKDLKAQKLIDNNVLIESLSEEFIDILTTASIGVPNDIMANIKTRIKNKL